MKIDFRIEPVRQLVTMSIRVDSALLNDLDRIATTTGSTRSNLARSALRAIRDSYASYISPGLVNRTGADRRDHRLA